MSLGERFKPVSPFSLPLKGPLYLLTTARMALRGNLPRAAEKYGLRVFNPLSLKSETLMARALGSERMRIQGREVEATREILHWYPPHLLDRCSGRILKEEAPLGLLREDPKQALAAGRQGENPPDLALAASIPVRRLLPSDRGPLIFHPGRYRREVCLRLG